MIVQIQKKPGSSLGLSVYMIAENTEERKDLQILVEALQKTPFLERNSHVSVGAGADNVLLVTSKGGASRRS
jgi:hypothetical protein